MLECTKLRVLHICNLYTQEMGAEIPQFSHRLHSESETSLRYTWVFFLFIFIFIYFLECIWHESQWVKVLAAKLRILVQSLNLSRQHALNKCVCHVPCSHITSKCLKIHKYYSNSITFFLECFIDISGVTLNNLNSKTIIKTVWRLEM